MQLWTKCTGYVIAAGVVGIALQAAPVRAQSTSLSFTSLPSAQGWTYFGNIAETTAFSVSNNTYLENSQFSSTWVDQIHEDLFQNTVGQSSATIAGYELQNVINTSLPFEMDMTAEVTSSTGSFEGFSFEAESGSKYFLISILTGNLEDNNGQSIALNTSTYHNYRLDANFSSNAYTLYVDGTEELTGTATNGSSVNTLFIGDGTGPSNADAQITQFSFIQGSASAPEPGALALMVASVLPGMGTIIARRRHSRKMVRSFLGEAAEWWIRDVQRAR